MLPQATKRASPPKQEEDCSWIAGTGAYHVLWLKYPMRRRVGLAVLIGLVALATRVHLAYSGRIEYDEKNYARVERPVRQSSEKRRPGVYDSG